MQRINVPDIGDFRDVAVTDVMISLGEAVAKDQVVAVLESDKATVDIPSPDAGVVRSIDIKVGDRVSAGSPLMILQLLAQDDTPAHPAKPSDPQGASPAASKTEGTDSRETMEKNEQRESAAVAGRAEMSPMRLHAGPAVRRLARELGVNLLHVSGSGRGGRIVLEDVRDHSNSLAKRSSSSSGTAGAAGSSTVPFALPSAPLVDFAKFGPVETQPLSRVRKIAGANLHRNWVMIPHVTNHDDADITDLEVFRAQLRREQGVKLSPLPFIVKACVAALKAFPDFNSSLDGETLILKRYFHIGIAADTPNGLMVPVVRDVDKKGVLQIAAEIAELAAKARGGKLAAQDMQGATFSISSLGGVGGGYFTPIINAPEVAILGAGKVHRRAVFVDDRVLPREYLPLSLSWDHRVVDGVAAARFNAFLVRTLGDLRQLLL